jgi:hypothetical protein
MAVSVNWATGVIFIPKNYLTLVSGVLYELDVEQFREDLKALEADADGMTFLDTHRHNSVVVLSGVSYAQTFEIINGYTVEFEDGQYTVRCVGANHNLADVKVPNQVSLIIGNTAGLVVTENADLAGVPDAVWAKIVDGSLTAEKSIRLLNAVLGGKVTGAGTGTEVFRNPDDTKDRVTAEVDASGNRTDVVTDLD